MKKILITAALLVGSILTSLPAFSAPDLIVDTITYNRATGILSGNVKNIGDTATTSGVTTYAKIWVDGVFRYNAYQVAQIPVGGTRALAVGWVPYNGSHTVRVDADTSLVVTESDETNNSLTATVDFGLPVPDITVSAPTEAEEVSGLVTLTASATSSRPITEMQFILDGVTNIGAAGTTSSHEVVWDTTTASTGAHAITVRAKDGWYNSNVSTPVNVTVANAFPDLTVDSIVFNRSTGILAGVIKNIGTAATTEGVVVYSKIYVDGVLQYNPYQSASIAPGESKSSAVGYISYSGVHLVKVIVDSTSVVAESNEGNNFLEVQIDFGLPVPDIAITYPLDSTTVSGSINVTATATPLTGVAITGVQFKLDGYNLGLDTVAPYSVPWNTTTNNECGHVLTATATDAWGHVNVSAPVSVNINNSTYPDLQVTSTTFNRTTGLLTIVFTNSGSVITPAATTIGIKTSVDGVLKYSSTYASQIAAGASVTITQDHIMDSGVHSASVFVDSESVVRETNESNNVKITSVDFGLPVPDVAITAPLNNAQIPGTVNITANATTVTGASISSVQFKDGGVNLGAADTSSPYALSWNTASATVGAHALTAVATDSWGHVNTSAIINVTVTRAMPDLTVLSTTFNRTTGILTSVIKNIGAAASPVTTVSFKTSVDGVVKYTPTYASSIAAGASVNVTQDHIMESGVHSVTVVADSASVVTETNEANNTLITSVNFGLPVPDVAITAPLNNATISGAVNITANATTVTGVAISSVQFKDGATVLGTDTSSPYALSWNTAITTNGGHALTAVATDAWGHVNTSAIINVTVNNGTAVSPYAIQGFAKTDGVTGGTGGVTRNVTNCYNDTRAGSFRAALAYNGPRIITFQPGLVCSNIVLAADVYIEYPNVTIDGAGANITFSTQTLFVRKANGGPIYNVIIKNLTFKDTVVNRQAIAIYGSSYKVWIDHNTFINNTSDPAATGQALGIFTNTTTTGFTGITISWNRFDPPGNDKCIAISEDNDTIQLGFRVSIHHNYFNECGARSPRVHGKGIYIHAWNNYHYAWREYGIGFGGYANLWVQNSIFENTSALYIKAVDPWYAQGAAGYYNSNSVRADNNTLVGLNGKPKPTIGTVGTFDTSKITYTFPLDLPDANLKARIIAGAGANR